MSEEELDVLHERVSAVAQLAARCSEQEQFLRSVYDRHTSSKSSGAGAVVAPKTARRGRLMPSAPLQADSAHAILPVPATQKALSVIASACIDTAAALEEEIQSVSQRLLDRLFEPL
jgi:hypothetical protein